MRRRHVPGRTSRRALIAGLGAALVVPAVAAESVQIHGLVFGTSIPESQRDATVNAARTFYEFWNTGDEADLKQAIAPSFTDHTLPSGRPQGLEGPAFASRQFRAAVPDLAVNVEKMIVAGDYVTVHMKFSGHFTGKFGQTQGKGQPIEFIATDIVKVDHGRITDNWHIEDNLTLLQQMDLAKVAP
ncbi:MAG TPA: ester cyclase [Alphaproteobacteria bacterium]